MKKLAACILFTALYSGSLLASDLNYNYLEIGYQSIDIDVSGDALVSDADPSGFFFGGSVELGESFYGFLNYKDGSGDSSEVLVSDAISTDIVDLDLGYSEFRVGVGYRYPMSDSAEFLAGVGLLDVSADGDLLLTVDFVDPLIPDFQDTASIDADDDGYFLGVGIRSMMGPAFELNGQIAYADFDAAGSETVYEIGAVYNFADIHGVSFKLGFLEDQTDLSLGYRYNFGL